MGKALVATRMRKTGWRPLAVLLVTLHAGAAVAFDDEFSGPLSADWAGPDTPLAGASVTSAVADADAGDGSTLELIYPGGTTADVSGPGWSTELMTAATHGYGIYEARLRPARARASEGVVSAFFTYFNDGLDHDGDDLVDNHEIDLEFLAAEPSVLYMTVWTAYQADGNGEAFRKTTRKIDLRRGRVWQTPPGGEGAYGLQEIAPLGWKVPGFKAWRAYRTYRFEWQPTQVTYAIDLEDGQGFRTLWTLDGAPDDVIPSHPAPTFVNLWHNASHWHRDRAARPPRSAVGFRVDRVTVP